MSEDLKKLLDAARQVAISPSDAETQRRSFAYGNTHFENEKITRDTVNRAAEDLAKRDGKKD